MITPNAFRLILKHFDEVDKVVSSKTVSKRPWLEVALTSLLCDMMDNDTQTDVKIDYTIKQLQEDLEKEDNLFGISLSIETIEYSPTYERYISQSDVGMKIIYDNKIEPKFSWIKPYLFQAKRLIPTSVNPLYYSETSRFSSVNKEQQKRIETLSKILGEQYIKYLLYCPRPENVDNDTRIKLAYLRNSQLSTHIFDFTAGLEIHKELLSSGETLKAGLFITDVSNSKINFRQVHEFIMQNVFPFSWFMAMNYGGNNSKNSMLIASEENTDELKLANGILSGDQDSIDEFLKRLYKLSNDNIPNQIQFLPKHTITVKLSVGEKIDSNRRFIAGE